MGGEYSRRNSLQVYEEGMMPQLMNNQQPLKFHNVRGDNIQLSRNLSVASRDDGFCKGIVFSQRPVLVNEYVYVKFLEISSSWSGGLRIGFTANDPVTVKHKLPKYACPCMTDMPGNWARAIAERFVQKDSVLFYYVNQTGEVHYGLNDEERGIFFGGVNTSGKLWAMMDIYGNTIRIELLSDQYYLRNSRHRPTDALCNNAIVALRNAAQEMTSIHGVQVTPLHFHYRYGKHVALFKNRTLAVHDASYSDHGYVFTESPIPLNDYVMIKISQCENNKDGFMFGVTSCDPSNLAVDELPDCPEDLFDRPEYWIVNRINEKCKPGDFAFIVNEDGAVKYSRNGLPLTTAIYVDHTLNLWYFFYLDKSFAQIHFVGSCGDLHERDVLSHMQSLTHQYSGIPISQHFVDMKQPLSGSSQMTAEGSGECVVCYEADKDTAIYRCGHVCMCFNCATQVYKSSKPQCPVCRDVIADIIKIYK